MTSLFKIIFKKTLFQELDTSNKTMLKNKESIVKIEKTVEDLETRTTETVER